MSDTWNAKIYSQFLNFRTRPAQDLLAAIPDSFQPKMVYDLGCGPGNSTILLKQRWPQARIVGLDSSLNMLKEAKAAYPELDFVEDDIASDLNPIHANSAIIIIRRIHAINHKFPQIYGARI